MILPIDHTRGHIQLSECQCSFLIDKALIAVWRITNAERSIEQGEAGQCAATYMRSTATTGPHLQARGWVRGGGEGGIRCRGAQGSACHAYPGHHSQRTQLHSCAQW